MSVGGTQHVSPSLRRRLRSASSPLTPTTTTGSPRTDRTRGAVADQISPWVATRPTPPGSIGVSAWPVLVQHTAFPGDGRLFLRLEPEADQEQQDARQRRRTIGRIRRSPICSSGSGESISIIEPNSRLAIPPTASRPWLDHLDLQDQQHESEQDQQEPGVVDRQDLEREERQQQADAADDAGHDGAGAPQLDRQARACRASAAGRRSGDARSRSGSAAASVISTSRTSAFVELERGRGAVEALDRPAVELPDQIRDVGGDDVDERRRGGQRLLLGERSALGARPARRARRCGRAASRASARRPRCPRPSSSPSPRRPFRRCPTPGARRRCACRGPWRRRRRRW